MDPLAEFFGFRWGVSGFLEFAFALLFVGASIMFGLRIRLARPLCGRRRLSFFKWTTLGAIGLIAIALAMIMTQLAAFVFSFQTLNLPLVWEKFLMSAAMLLWFALPVIFWAGESGEENYAREAKEFIYDIPLFPDNLYFTLIFSPILLIWTLALVIGECVNTLGEKFVNFSFFDKARKDTD